MVQGMSPSGRSISRRYIGADYRFIGQCGVRSPECGVNTPHQPQHPTPSTQPGGREAELRQLHKWLEKALSGERQLVFVTGEPGIGKTTVVDAFLQSLGLASRV